MVRRPRSAADDLRAFIAAAVAQNLLAKWKDVLAAVENWTDGRRHEPATPSLAHGNDALQAADGRAPALGGR